MKSFWIVAMTLLCTTAVLAQDPRPQPSHATSRPTQTAPRSLTQLTPAAIPMAPKGSALHKIIQSQILRVCVRSDVPPFGYFASQGLVGFDIELAKHIAMQLSIYYKKNIHIQWKVIEASERIAKLQAKQCDFVAASFSYTAQRASQVTFSRIYLQTRKVALAAERIQRAEPIIALVKGTTNAHLNIKGQTRYFVNYKEIMQAMKSGDVDYVVTDQPIAIHMMRNVTKSFRMHKAFPRNERYGLGLNKSHTHLVHIVNKALYDLAKTGRLAYLYRQWL